MAITRARAVSTARRGAKRAARTARQQALAGYGLATGRSKPVRGEIAAAELVALPGRSEWCVRVNDRLYEVDAEAVRQLATLLPATTARRSADVGTATFDPGAGLTRPSLELRRGAEVRTVSLDPSAAAVLAPVSLSPQPFHDEWIQTAVTVTAESTERVELHLYLPPSDDLPPKRYLVLSEDVEVGSGELKRGGESSLIIDAPALASGRRFDVHLAYSDPAPESDHRRLGAVLKGVTKWLDPRTF